MTLHPDALDRIIPGDPRDAVRARYAEFAMEDRLPDPNEFDAREEPARFTMWIAVVAVILIGCSLIASIH